MSPTTVPSSSTVRFWRRPRFFPLLAGGLVATLYLAPFLFAALNRFECFAYANESIAYRWGHSSRVAFGDIPPILPQGFTVFAAQQWIVKLVEFLQPLSAATLRDNLQLFSWATFFFFIALFLLTLVSAWRQRTLGGDGVFLAYLPLLVSFYGTGFLGLYYCLLPDYYHLNVILGCAYVLFLFRLVPALTPLAPFPFVHLAALGVILGLGVANKVTWVVPGAFALGFAALAGPMQFLKILGRCAVLGGAAALTGALVLLAYYRFNAAQALQGINEWLGFMKGQEGSIKLWSPAFFSTLQQYNFDVLFPLEAATLLAGLIFVRGWRLRIAVVLTMLSMGLLLWMVTRRPASTSLWDLNILMTALSAIALLLIQRVGVRRGVCAIWVVTLAALMIRHPPSAASVSIRAAELATQNRFEVFSELNRFAGKRPQLVLLLNNEYGYGGVHELLLKAASDFPTWNVSQGRTWLLRIADITFYHEYGHPFDQLPADLRDKCIIWFNRPDLPPLETVYDRLGALLRDPAYEHITLHVHMMNLAQPPQVQSIVHAVRLKPGGQLGSTLARPSTPPLPGEPSGLHLLSEAVAALTPLSGRRLEPTVVELTWPPGDGLGKYEIQMASEDGAMSTIGRGVVQPGRHIVGDVSATATYHFRTRRWLNGRDQAWSKTITVPPP